MRILHTSDWHLGRGLHGVDLAPAHADMLDQVVAAVDEHNIDVVVVAGDVYDRAIPPVGSVTLLNEALTRLCDRVPVILTPGNHDSAVRLGFGAGLFTRNLHIRSDIAAIDDPILLEDEHGTVAFFAFPFLDPESARSSWDPQGELGLQRSHQAVFEHAMDKVRAQVDDAGHRRSVVVAHAFVVGAAAPDTADSADSTGSAEAETSESERDLSVGGVQTVTAEVFEGVSYVALGHLHGTQQPRPATDDTVIRYSGSPLRFSFSEIRHTKSLTVTELGPDGVESISTVPVVQPRDMSRIRGTFDDLIDPAGPFAAHTADWVEITVTDSTRPEEMAARLRQRFPHYLMAKHVPDRVAGSLDGAPGSEGRGTGSPMDILREFVEKVGGAPATEAETDVLENAVRTVLGAGA